jgi:hypothetical protein
VRLSEEWHRGRRENVDDKRGIGIVSTFEWKTQTMPRTGTGVVVKMRKGNRRFVMATLPSIASIPSSSANNVELHSTFISASSGSQSFTPDDE